MDINCYFMKRFKDFLMHRKKKQKITQPVDKILHYKLLKESSRYTRILKVLGKLEYQVFMGY